MNLNKTLIALALSSALAACGGSSDSAAPVIEPPPEQAAPVETIVEGKAVKGVLNNAVVTVYKFVEGAAVALTAEELSEADIVTDEFGNYTFTVLDYTGPIKIELSPSTDPANPTTMICDAPNGCGGVALGGPIDLTAVDPDFKLAAISVVDADNSGEVKLNVSALTHLAAELIEADENGINAEVVAAQSATVASNFGIIGDITLLEPTVTTEASAVVEEDNENELRYGLINAGIMEAIFSGEADSSAVLSTKLAEVADDLIANEGALLVNQDSDDDFELSLADVLTGAADAADAATDAISAAATAAGVDLTVEELATLTELAQEEVNLANEQAYQEANVGDDGLASTGVDVPTEGDAIAKAKAMVADIRLFSHLFDVTKTEGAGIKTQGDEYVALLDSASLMMEQEADSFTLLAKISDVIADLTVQYDAGTLTNATTSAGIAIPDGILSDAGTGTITFNENTASGGVLFSVNASDAGEIVQLNIVADFATDGLSITLTLDGLVESAGATFTIKTGSFATIAFDSVASRTAFDNDTFEGEIVSGELELELELAQKATDSVVNPVTFSGMLKTKLLPTSERSFDDASYYDYEEDEFVRDYTRPELETVVLPEMLSLTGGFSSLEGDSINATLTVNLDNILDHEAPDFEYIGKEFSDVLNITVSDDLNTVVRRDGDSVSDETEYTLTYMFLPGSEEGELTLNRTTVPTHSDDSSLNGNIERRYVSQRFDTGLNEKGIIYSYAYIKREVDGLVYSRSVRITPLDTNQDGQRDSYSFETKLVVGSDNLDGTSLDTLLDSDGNMLNKDGTIHSEDNFGMLGEFSSIEAFMSEHSDMRFNPLTVTNGAEAFVAVDIIRNGKSKRRLEDGSGVTIYFDEDELATIAAGEIKEFNPTAYLTQPLLKDFLTIEVSADENTVTTLINNEVTESKVFNYTGDVVNAGNFEVTSVFNKEYYSQFITELSQTTDIGLDVEEVLITKTYTYSDLGDSEWAEKIKITPVDTDQDNIADTYQVFFINGEVNDDGMLVDSSGGVIDFSGYWYEFTSYNDVNWNSQFDRLLEYNPFTVDSALAFAISDVHGSFTERVYFNDFGGIEYEMSEEELLAITANSTTSFDAILVEPNSTSSFENEENYLNVNAALTLEAVLGDYEVKAQLSGDRTSFSEGKFGLELTYSLPGEDAQRSFTVNYDTQEEGQLTAKNFEDVVLVLEEADENVSGTQVIGQILVGPTAIVAATIEDRDGIIVIVYGVDDEDPIREVEAL